MIQPSIKCKDICRTQLTIHNPLVFVSSMDTMITTGITHITIPVSNTLTTPPLVLSFSKFFFPCFYSAPFVVPIHHHFLLTSKFFVRHTETTSRFLPSVSSGFVIKSFKRLHFTKKSSITYNKYIYKTPMSSFHLGPSS